MTVLTSIHRVILGGAAVALVVLFARIGGQAQAGEVKVFCSTALKGVMEDLGPQFELAKKQKLTITYGTSAALKQRIEGGEAFDLAVLTPGPTDDLIKQGKLVRETRTQVARTGMAIGIRRGGRKPDIRSVDALKRTLLDTRSVVYAKEGAAGVYFLALLRKLGIADAMKPKSQEMATGEEVGTVLESGLAELGILPVSELMPFQGVEVLGQFPAEVQEYAVAVATVGASARDAAVVKDLIKFLMTPEATEVVKKKGMERG